MTLRLNGSTSGYVEIDAPATAGSNTLVLPTGNGSANQFLKNGSTAGSLGWSSMVETATGVGIGVTPSYLVDASAATGTTTIGDGTVLRLASSTTNGDCNIRLGSGTNATTRIGVNGADFYAYVNGAERVRILSSGGVAIGKTAASESPTTGSGFGFADAANDPFFSIVNTNASGGNACIYLSKRTTGAVVNFYSNNGTTNTQVGSISHNGSSTAYNTSSDYRLKESVAPITGGINRLQQLKPCKFNFIAEPDRTVDGFLAHEVQQVIPEAITGEKDAVDEDGNPIYQGIDQSKLVPLLTAALQEAIGRIETQDAAIAALETRLAALEATP
jgi:hypothetical protein